MTAWAAALLLAAGASAGAPPSSREPPPRFYGMTEGQIASALRKIHRDHTGLASRVEAVSASFLGTPYKLGPLGEGEDGEFDRDPLYSFAQADCVTFVEQVMALSLEPELAEALSGVLQKIRYRDGKVGYATRNHFTEVDWLPANAAAGFVADITAGVAGDKVKRAAKTISKREWYARKTLDDLQGFDGAPQAERERRLKALQSLGSGLADEDASVPYVPIESLPELLPKIPSGAIASLVREDKPDKPVLISHQALLIDKGGVKFVRHAAAGRQVEDVPALEYFYKYFNASWRLLGLNLGRIR
ncbi:MAG: DUF1460 domain-containing protein [Elusimicrobia bacterium]|nr:DUF1460 domain-containing protein [Elusimicrobiota bacterium]